MVPPQLRNRPFSLDEARMAGVSASTLKGKSWLRIGSRLYRSAEASADPWGLLAVHRGMLPQSAVFVGLTAAWMHGLDLAPASPVQVALPADSKLRSRAGLEIRHCAVAGETVTIRGLAA